MSSSTSAIFSGNSRYASDFQTVIDRAVAIASLPMTQLNSDKTKLTDQSTALTALDTKVSALQTSLASIGDALGTGSFQADVSDTAAVSATVGEGAVEGTYSVKVLGLGSYTTTLSPPPGGGVVKVSDPGKSNLNAGTDFVLTLSGQTPAIQITATTLNGLADAINSKAGSDVRATVVNVGSSGDPDYRLSVRSTRLGDEQISLAAGSTVLLEEQSRGQEATYNVNGAQQNGADLVAQSDSRTVTLAPGLTVTLLAPSKGAASSITVTRQSSALSGALEAFANAYNAVADEMDKHRGQAGGALSGSSAIASLNQIMADVSGYTGSGKVASLSGLGLSFDQNGRLSFSPLLFMAADFQDSAAVASFLGSKDSGGFLHAASAALDDAELPGTGTLKGEIDYVTGEISGIDTRIASQQSGVDQLKSRLTEQMAAADAMIASMEQQYNYISSMFQAMQVASESYK